MAEPTSKAERGAAMLAEAAAARARLEASTELRCEMCGALVLKYDAPAQRITLPCRRCKAWIDFSTELTTTGAD